MDNKGLTLLELIVSIAILAIVVLPLLTAFLVSLKTNVKAKEKLRAIEVAHNFMEAMEAVPVTDIMTQLTYTDEFDLLEKHSTVKTQQLLKQTDKYVKADSIQDLLLIDPSKSESQVEALATTSILRYADGTHRFISRKDGKYYYYVNNIPSEDGKKYYTAMITIDAKATTNPAGEIVKDKYNDMVITNIESINQKFDALNLDVITNATLLSDINIAQGLSMTEDDLKYLTRTITIDIKPEADKKKAKVILSYSYECKDYPEVNAEGDPVMDDATGLQKMVSFHFPDAANEDKYTKVIFDNTADTEGKTYLRDIYLFYDPWYTSTQMDILRRSDNIFIKNEKNYDCTVKLVKQKWVSESVLKSLEDGYRLRVDLKENTAPSEVAHTKIETNIGTNISDNSSVNQAVYIYNGSVMNSYAIYDAADNTVAGPDSSTRLWVTKGFGIEEKKDRIYDVIVDIYPNPNAGLSSAEELEKIFNNSLKPIVELTGGLID